MKNTKYVALMLALSMVASPITTHAQTTDIVEAEEVSETPLSEEKPVNGVEVEASSNVSQEYEEVLLDYKPDDLVIELPDNFNLSLNDEDSYSYEGVVHVSGANDSAYRVDIKLKDVNIKYTNMVDASQTINGVAYLGESDVYSVSYEDVAGGFDIPIRIEADKADYVGQFTTTVSFSIDIYENQLIELKETVEEQPTEEIPIFEEEVIIEEEVVEEEDTTIEEDTTTDEEVIVEEDTIAEEEVAIEEDTTTNEEPVEEDTEEKVFGVVEAPAEEEPIKETSTAEEVPKVRE